ncbi:MAG: sigma-E factor negative regulatory protein [Pseudomonadota bacterium]
MMKTATQTLSPSMVASPVPADSRAEQEARWSALLDGELDDLEAMRLLASPGEWEAGHARLREYMAVGDALRGLYPVGREEDFTARVMAALEHEPTVLAPVRRAPDRRPLLWLAAAAVGAITWGLWGSLPDAGAPVPMAANTPPAGLDVQPYLAAHQDFAQAVIAPAEMNFTQVSLAEVHR